MFCEGEVGGGCSFSEGEVGGGFSVKVRWEEGVL